MSASETLSDVVDDQRTTIVTASDSDEEVRWAARSVVDAVRDGTPLDRIAILYASPEPYARLLQEQMAAAGIGINGTAFAPLDGRTAPRALLRFLALPENNFSRPAVFTWLTSAPMLIDGRWVPVTAWERLSRDAGVIAGRDDWDTRLRPPRRRARRSRRRRRGGSLTRRTGWSSGAAAKPRRHGRSASSCSASSTRSSKRRRRRDRGASTRAGRRSGSRRCSVTRTINDGWPLLERNAAEKLERALARLEALDSVEGPVSLDVFARTLKLELESDLGRVGRFGDGVFVGTVRMGIGLDLDLVVILGLAEGSFPSTVREDSLAARRRTCTDQRRAAVEARPRR